MSTIFIIDQGSYLSKKNDRLLVKKDNDILRWIHLKDIDQLILVGNVSLTSPVITYLLKHKVDTVFLSYYGKYKGRLISEFGKNVILRHQQFCFLSKEEYVLTLSKRFVSGKIENCLYLLRKNQYRNPDTLVASKIMKLAYYLENEIPFAEDMDKLRGFEGFVAREYFSVFQLFIKNNDFVFNGRTRRPPRDEVNALLSISYTFLMNLILSKAYIAGLDPFYGALHDVSYGRSSLVLDLMEEFRPLIDNFVINLINRREIRKDHFILRIYNQDENINFSDEIDSKSLPVYLTNDGLRKIVVSFNSLTKKTFFYKRRNCNLSFDDIVKAQLYLLVECFKGNEEYHSFKWGEGV